MSLNRRLAGVATGLLVLVTAAAPAAAHVTVNPREATKGGFAKLAFRTPNERPDSGTVKLEVVFPAEHPIPNVSVRPHPGWTFALERTTLAEPIEREGGDPLTEVVSKITWTGGTINPGEFDEFEVSVGPLPEDADQMVFKALQTYASGEVVSWIEEAAPGGEEPEHPAPVLTLADAEEDGAEAPAATDEPAATAANVASEDDVDSAKGLSTIALVVGGLGLVAGIAGFVRRRPPAGAGTAPAA